MKKNKVLACLLAAAMTTGVLAGCGSGDSGNSSAPASNPSSGEAQPSGGSEGGYTYTGEAPVTKDANAALKIMARTSNYTNVDIANAEIVKTVVANSGVNVEWELIDYNSYEQAVGPRLDTGSADADIILIPDQDATQKYIKSGMFEPLDTHFDVMPNFTKWLDANPVIKAQITAEDGHIYYVPGTNVGKDYQPVLMYNQKWLKQAGMEAPETLDDLVALLRYFKENDMNGNGDPNDEIPMSLMEDMLPYMFGPAFGLDLPSGFQGDDSGKVFYGYADSENYKAYLEFLKGLYDEGLLEKEYVSLTRDMIMERCANDQTGVTFDFSWSMSMNFSNKLPYYDENDTDTVFLGAAPLSGPSEGYYVGRVELGNMFGVNASSGNIELACMFLDYAMSEPCQEMYQWGIEGESYTVDASGNKAYTEKASDNDWLQQLGINPAFVFPAQQSVASTDALLPAWHAECNAWQRQFVVDPWPFVYSTEDEKEILDTCMEDLNTYTNTSATEFITGTRSLDEFDAYVKGFDSLNLQEVLAVKQAQYDRYLAALK